MSKVESAGQRVEVTDEISLDKLLFSFELSLEREHYEGEYRNVSYCIGIFKEAILENLVASSQFDTLLQILWNGERGRGFNGPREKNIKSIKGFEEFLRHIRAGMNLSAIERNVPAHD